ncbi:MAG: hypothetical protein NTX59_01940 [Elusimicrobia bacterium]|nr:hypothetical protein [Elusimicrobiota bacterium]
MNRKLVFLTAVSAILAVPAVYSAAQDQGGGGPDERESVQREAPGPDQEMGPDMQQRQKEGFAPKRGVKKGFAGEAPFGEPGLRGGGGPMFLAEDEVISVIKKHDAKFAETITGLKETSPGEYKMLLMMSGKLLGQARMENDDKIEADAVRGLFLEYETKRLSRKYEKAADADKEGVKAELKAKVAELFDLRLVAQGIKVKRIESDLAHLKKSIESRKVNKDKIVQERVGQLTGENLGW